MEIQKLHVKSEDVKALARQSKNKFVSMVQLLRFKKFGVDEVIEIGPGKRILSGFLKKIDKLFQLIALEIPG